MDIITIDPSINCTALTINGKIHVFAADHICLTKTGKLNKWFEAIDDHCTIHVTYVQTEKKKSYCELEVDKLNIYKRNVDSIVRVIQKERNVFSPPHLCLIEGYAYSSAAGPLIDLVTFGTLLRDFIQSSGNDVFVIAPTSMKLAAAKLTYPPIETGKKVKKTEYRNKEGVAGGKFTKTDMCKALIEMERYNSPWQDFLRENQEEILSLDKVPKALEDINDAMLMHFIVRDVVDRNQTDNIKVKEELRQY